MRRDPRREPDRRELAAIVLHLPRRDVWIDTASGSRYRIDPLARTWARLGHDPRSDALRSEGGPLLGLADAPTVGEPAVLVCPPHVPGADVRVVVTTPVVRVWDRQPDGPHRPAAGWWDA
jgi:hypothetical protein